MSLGGVRSIAAEEEDITQPSGALGETKMQPAMVTRVLVHLQVQLAAPREHLAPFGMGDTADIFGIALALFFLLRSCFSVAHP